MSQVDLLLARAQVALGALLILGFIGVIFTLLLHPIDLPDKNLTLLTGVISYFSGIVTAVGAFFYARHRATTSIDGDVPIEPVAPANSQPTK